MTKHEHCQTIDRLIMHNLYGGKESIEVALENCDRALTVPYAETVTAQDMKDMLLAIDEQRKTLRFVFDAYMDSLRRLNNETVDFLETLEEEQQV
jgi:arginine decarboxylase-like protein